MLEWIFSINMYKIIVNIEIVTETIKRMNNI